jgi:hypothetical protein
MRCGDVHKWWQEDCLERVTVFLKGINSNEGSKEYKYFKGSAPNSPGETEEGYAEISGKKACPLTKIKIGYLHNIKNTAVPKCISVY